MHRRTSEVVKVQRAFESREMMVFPVVAPDELVSASARLAPHMAVVRCSNLQNGLDLVRWIHGQLETARLPLVLLGPIDPAECPKGLAGLLGCLDERRPHEQLADELASLAPSQPIRRPASSGSGPAERPSKMLARLAGEGRTGLLVVSDDDGCTTVVSVGPEIRRSKRPSEEQEVDAPFDSGAHSRVEFIETGEQQRLGVVDLSRGRVEAEVPPLPADVRALVVEHDESSAGAVEAALGELGVDAMRLAPTPGWLEHAVDYWPDVIVSDARPRGPRGFEFLREQAIDPVLSWVPTLLLAAPTASTGPGRAMAMGVLAAELHQALGPRLELERLLEEEGPRKGHLERFGIPRLLRTVCELRRDAVVGNVDDWNAFVFSIRDGRLVGARQHGKQGGRSAGPGALARSLLTRSGSFTVGPPDTELPRNLSGELDTQLSGSRAMIRSLSSERGPGPGRALGCDEGMLHKRLEGTDPRRAVMIEALIMGTDPRRAAQQVGFRPEEARELLEDLFRFGAIGIVRHLEGDPRPSSDEAVSALSRYAAGVPEELRPLFEFEETEVSSFSTGHFDYDPDVDGPFDAEEEVSVSKAGVDLSLDVPSPTEPSDETPLPQLDVGIDALVEEGETEEDPAALDRTTDLPTRVASQPPPSTARVVEEGARPPDASFFVEEEETGATIPKRPSRPSGIEVFRQGPGPDTTPETRTERPSGLLSGARSSAASPGPPEPSGVGLGASSGAVASGAASPRPPEPSGVDFGASSGALESGAASPRPSEPSGVDLGASSGALESGVAPAAATWPPEEQPQAVIETGRLPAQDGVGFSARRRRLIVMGASLMIAVVGGIVTGLIIIRCRAHSPAAGAPVASVDASAVSDGSLAAVATRPGPSRGDAAPEAPARDASASSDAGAVEAGGAPTDAAAAGDARPGAPDGAPAQDGDVAVAAAPDAAGVEQDLTGVALRSFGPPIRVPSDDHSRRRLARRELRLGTRATKRRDYERAAWHYQRATKLVRRSPVGLVGLGESLAALGRHEEARQVLDVAIDASSGHYVLVRAGYACLSAGDNACARRAFEKALQRRSSRAAHRGLATVRAAERRDED